MNALIEILNRWGEIAIPLAGQALWQSSLLIVVLLALDLLLRHRVRAGFRYAMWMLLLVKLVLPPSLALPTGAGYWIDREAKPEVALVPADPVVVSRPSEVSYVQVDDSAFDRPMFPATVESTQIVAVIPPAPTLTRAGWMLATWLAGIIGLLAWMLGRWRWVNRLVRASEPAPTELQALLVNVCRAACPTSSGLPAACRQSGSGALGETRPTSASVLPAACRQAGRDRRSVRSGGASESTSASDTAGVSTNAEPSNGALGETRPTIAVHLTDTAMSPAVCGLFRPVILLPSALVAKLTTEQLGTVLLHELIHLRRRDLWVNCAQTLLQIAAWWHPLLWVANARIRRVREEAVDEAVACALRDDADAYPATLLEVAKLTFTRPLLTLGLVGILESKNALKQRIRRLLELPPLESTRLKWWQWVAVVTLALTALPMAEGQQATDRANGISVDAPASAESKPTAQLETREFRVNPITFYQSLERISASLPPYTNSSGAVLIGSQAFQSATEADGVTLLNHFIRAYFEKLGVKLEPPKSVFFNVRKGSLLVRATIEELEIVQQALEELNTEPAQITLEVRVVEVRAVDVAALGNEIPRLKPLTEANRSYVAALSDTELNNATNLVGSRGLELKPLMRITTLSGRNTELRLRDTPLFVAPKFGALFDKLEVNPYALLDRENLQLTIITTIRARAVDDQGKGSPHAYFLSQQASTAAMKNGETIALAVSAGLDDSEKNDGNLRTLVFITPTIIDPVGNRLGPVVRSPTNQGQIMPQSNSGNPVAQLQKELANAQAEYDRAQRALGSKREQLKVDELWLLDDAVLQHPFVKRHVERLGLTPPAEFATAKEAYRLARNVRDSVDLRIAQEVINRQIEARLQAGSAPEVNTRSEAAVREQLDFLARSVDQMRIELQAATERLGRDPLEHPDQDLNKAEFLKSLPVVEAAVRLQQAEQRHDIFRQALENRNQASSGSTSSDAIAAGHKVSRDNLQQAKVLIELGKLVEAEAMLREAARIEPGNAEIAYQLDRIQQLKTARPKRELVEVDQASPQPNPNVARDPQVYTSAGRHLLMEKLNKITLDEVRFDGVPLVEVVKELTDEARRRDPNGGGITFMIASTKPSPAEGANQQSVEDLDPADLGATIIDINPPLLNLKLIDALQAVTMAADRRIKFTVEEFGVVFTPTPPPKEKLETREFRVNPQAFNQTLLRFSTNLPTRVFSDTAASPRQPNGWATTTVPPGVRFLTTTNDMAEINAAVLRYFEPMGVSLTPPKALYYNDRTGLLLVLATAEDFQFIERAIETFNSAPPRMQLELRAIELSPEEVKAMASGFPAYLFPPVAPANTNAVPASASFSAILTAQQFTNILSGLRLVKIDAPETTEPMRTNTLSGRQTQFKTAQTFTVVTNVANTPAGPQYETSDIELGKFWELTPEVSADGYTIHLGAKFDRVEFLGYNDPAAAGKPPGTPLPHFSVRSVSTKVSLWDGQTLVMSGITIDTPKLAKDKVPVLGDIPLVGKMFRYEKRFVETKHVVVFITPTIIDSAGNPLHKPGELPLANELVPPPRPTEP